MKIEPTEQQDLTFEERMELHRKRHMFQFFDVFDGEWYFDPTAVIASSILFYRGNDCTDAELVDHICSALNLYMSSHDLCIVPCTRLHSPYATKGLSFKKLKDVAKEKR